jgi:dipeptidyl aminopeptidase/acylaminoacyl peptidase
MPDLDEYLRNEFQRTVRSVDVHDVSSRIDLRRARRARARKVQAVALAMIVIAGTLGGVAVLSSVFRKGPIGSVGDASPFPIVPKANGVIVAAQQLRSGPIQLVSVNPDGSGQQVIRSRITGDPWLPAWSPDGTRLAVGVFPSDAPRAIWVMDADGANPVKIVEGDNVSRPSWSPDGTEIAVAVDTKEGSSIHIVKPDGTGDRVIGDTIQGKDYFSASFSPDGTQLVFDRGTDSGFGIFVMNVDGSGLRRIGTGSSDYNPSWSPDGTQIVFTRQEEGAESDIYVMDADGSNVTRLTNDGPGVTNLNAGFSPDGKRIAYVAGVTGGPGSVVVMEPDGAHPVTILNDGVIDISWQPLPIGSTPAPAVADMGLGFPVCDVQSMSADFDGNGTPDTASVATKMSDVGGCPAPGTSTEVIVVDLSGDGKADASGGPLACPTGCEPFATPDVNGDGLPEIAIVVDRPDNGTERIQLWDLTTPPGGSLAVIPFVDANGDPATFSWGTDGTNTYGVSCTNRTSPPLVTEWQAIPTGPNSWHVSEHGYHVVGTEFRSAFEDSYDVPGEETVFPDGGDYTMCGAPVHASG